MVWEFRFTARDDCPQCRSLAVDLVSRPFLCDDGGNPRVERGEGLAQAGAFRVHMATFGLYRGLLPGGGGHDARVLLLPGTELPGCLLRPQSLPPHCIHARVALLLVGTSSAQRRLVRGGLLLPCAARRCSRSGSSSTSCVRRCARGGQGPAGSTVTTSVPVNQRASG